MIDALGFPGPLAAAGVLGLAALWASLRPGRPHLADLGLQLLVAALLYATLFPPSTSRRGDVLVVITPGSGEQSLGAWERGLPAVALPGAQAPARAERVPDLASALRNRPAVSELRVFGGGLPLRDQPAAAGYRVRFEPQPGPGLSELSAPVQGLLGAHFPVTGVQAGAGRIELRDPSGAVIDETQPLVDGRFVLGAVLRAEGETQFEVRLLNPEGQVIERASLPVRVVAGVPLKVLVVAAGPDPGLKVWRRWAADAGLSLRSSIALSEGVSVHTDTPIELSSDSLAEVDLVLLDERSWTALAPEAKARLLAAVDQGLGLLLRITGSVPKPMVAEGSLLGFQVRELPEPERVTLDRHLGARERVAFALAPVRIGTETFGPETLGPETVKPETSRLRPLVSADDGQAVAWWSARGAGRIGVWALLDDYSLSLRGDSARYGSLWSETLAQVARGRASAPDSGLIDSASGPLPVSGWVDEQIRLCGLEPGAAISPPQGPPVSLIVVDACSAYWPGSPGWHRIRSQGRTQSLYVRPLDDAPGLRQARDQRATEQLAATPARPSAPTLVPVPMSRWPFFLAWLLASAALWAWERRRVATRPATRPATGPA